MCSVGNAIFGSIYRVTVTNFTQCLVTGAVGVRRGPVVVLLMKLMRLDAMKHEVRGNQPMRFVSLFSGIGGIDLGLERAGMTCVGQVENDPWCNQILEKHWPTVPRWQDIHDLDPKELPDHDLIVGGFPCQPVSLAGARLAQSDPRWLWPEFFRIVRVVRPRFVVVENVPGLASAGMGDVLGDLAQVGYDCEWQSIPAAFVGAPHLRWRIFIVGYPNGFDAGAFGRVSEGPNTQSGGNSKDAAHANGDSEPSSTVDAGPRPGELVSYVNSERRGTPEIFRSERPGSAIVRDDGTSQQVADAERVGLERSESERVFESIGERLSDPGWWAVEPDVGRVADGVPRRVDRLRGLGNAVVPQVAELVGRMIMDTQG